MVAAWKANSSGLGQDSRWRLWRPQEANGAPNVQRGSPGMLQEISWSIEQRIQGLYASPRMLQDKVVAWSGCRVLLRFYQSGGRRVCVLGVLGCVSGCLLETPVCIIRAAGGPLKVTHGQQKKRNMQLRNQCQDNGRKQHNANGHFLSHTYHYTHNAGVVFWANKRGPRGSST